MSGHRFRSGFTIVDMATSLAVILLLSAMVVPSLRRMSDAQRVGRAARVLAADLERGFSLATRIRRPVILTCRCDAKVFEVRLAGTDSVIYERRLDGSSGFNIGTLTSSGDATVSQSAVSSREVTFAMQLGTSQRSVILSTAGLARVMTP